MKIKRHLSKPKIPSSDFISEAIQAYIDKSKFPKKIELKRIQMTTKFLKDKTKQNYKVINEAEEKSRKLSDAVTKLKIQTHTFLSSLQTAIN